MSENQFILSNIENRIFTIRGVQVMIDRDLAELYNVNVKALNQAVKRNYIRFPEQYRFPLTNHEKNELVTNCDRFKNLKHSSTNPYAFTEQGVAMLSAVLKSDIAIQVSMQIINAFVAMRKTLANNQGIIQRLDGIEKKQLESEQKFEKIFTALEKTDVIPAQGVFFDGQVFDAYQLVSKIIRSAKKPIVLIDNYVDDTVLVQLGKKNKNVAVTILTKTISQQLALDAKKANAQYPTIVVKEFSQSHDRFLIIDEQEVYHLGASLKDLGKKWFAFSKLDKSSVSILNLIAGLI